jgi:uncharacterized protein
MSAFIGRQEELKRLQKAMSKRVASFIIIKGRRRIGKSRLIKEFGKNFEHFYTFSGLPPDDATTVQEQINEFCMQMSKNFHIPMARYNDWNDALWALADRIKQGKILLLFDEISWMGSKDHLFLAKIKNFWDLYAKNNPHLIFIVCGSASSWIEKNIMSSTGFVGRISFTMTLEELSLSECSQFWPKNISAYEKFKVLAVTGGIPKYLEEVDKKMSAEENIKNLCFTRGGFLVEEFDQIFSDLFLRDSNFYKKIIKALAKGQKEQAEIQKILGLQTQSRLAEYLWELEQAGFISRDYTWNIKEGVDSKLSRYRLSDNYIRFYLKYIEKNEKKINKGSFYFKSLSFLPEWNSILGFQFENLVLKNRKIIHDKIGIKAEDIICENPYFQRANEKQKGCQVDYMIQTKYDTLYICEIKFSKQPVESSIIEEMQKKIKALACSKRFSCRPVLIHVNGVSEETIECDYFAAIIDFSTLL